MAYPMLAGLIGGGGFSALGAKGAMAGGAASGGGGGMLGGLAAGGGGGGGGGLMGMLGNSGGSPSPNAQFMEILNSMRSGGGFQMPSGPQLQEMIQSPQPISRRPANWIEWPPPDQQQPEGNFLSRGMSGMQDVMGKIRANPYVKGFANGLGNFTSGVSEYQGNGPSSMDGFDSMSNEEIEELIMLLRQRLQ